jgi:hypothetical protein
VAAEAVVVAEVVAAVAEDSHASDYARDPVWLRINGLIFDDNSHSLTFSKRLARENGWAHWFALDVIEEYKRFLYLMSTAGHPVTPSIEVDQAWHLHLIYTRHYWEEFARHMPFEPHHGPTKGGIKESDKFNDWYTKTLESYKMIFGMDPPVNIWPDPSIRFRDGQSWQWVDTSQYLLLHQSTGYVMILIGALVFLALLWFSSLS